MNEGCLGLPQSAGGLVVVFLAVSLITTIPSPVHYDGENGSDGQVRSSSRHRDPCYISLVFAGCCTRKREPGALAARAKNLRPCRFWLTIGRSAICPSTGYCRLELSPNTPPWVMKLILVTAFCFCCTLQTLPHLAWPVHSFNQLVSGRPLLGKRLRRYIFHYGFVIWLQFVLLAQPHAGGK